MFIVCLLFLCCLFDSMFVCWLLACLLRRLVVVVGVVAVVVVGVVPVSKPYSTVVPSILKEPKKNTKANVQ